jgi:transcriptional regulator with XRE-family HTH domain
VNVLGPTLSDGLKRYSIGDKLRALRLRKKLGLVQLGEHTRLSPALLSKIERGKVFPTLPTLLRIAMVFSVGLDYFFRDESKRHVFVISRHKERLKFPERGDASDASYFFESLDFEAVERKLSAYFAEFQRVNPNKIRLHEHEGVEFIYVVSGKLGLRVGSEDSFLDAGDSVYFDSSVAHGYWNAIDRRTTAVVVSVR